MNLHGLNNREGSKKLISIYFVDDFNYSAVSKNIYSTFYIKIEDHYFPDKQWTDFPVAILRMWCENLLSNRKKFELYFLDGPFYIDCSREENNNIRIQLINNSHEKIVEKESLIDENQFTSMLYETSISLIQLIEKKQFTKVTDLDELISILRNIKLQLVSS